MKFADPTTGLDESVGRTVLRSIHGKGRVDGVLLTMTLRQAYRNDSRVDIEAIYTFPLAWAATLLELTVEIGGRRLTGQIVEKPQAQQDYEQAIDKGDAAVMVERAGKDLYTVNVGNLKAGEEAVVELRYAQMLPHDHDTLRLTVPTALAPRYGDAVNAGKLQPHQVPQTDLLASQDFALELELAGAAAGGTIRSPSHRIQFARHGDEARISIAGPALLDRDFLLTVEGLPQSSFAYVGEDQVRPGEYVIAGSFCPKLADLGQQGSVHPDPATRALLERLSDEEVKTLLRLATGDGRTVVNLQERDLRAEWDQRLHSRQTGSLTLKVLVDCSGSMAGDSMAQARAALAVLLEQLNANDVVSYSRFGSHVEHDLYQAECGRRHMAALRRAFKATDADLGGTELGQALMEVVTLERTNDRLMFDGGDADILLITDGEVWDVEGTIAELRHSGHRVHTVGVGAAPAQSLLQELADATGGGCRLVHPGEDMRVAITELMQGLRRAIRIRPHMVIGYAWHWGQVMRLQPGQTLLRWGRISDQFENSPALVLDPVDEAIRCYEGPVSPSSGMHAPETVRVPGDTLARMWAQQMMLQEQDQRKARQIALDYRLMSEQTNLLLVHERAEGEKASGMPQVALVPHMLAAGWGGVTRVDMAASVAVPAVWRTNRTHDKACEMASKDPLNVGELGDFEIPAFLRRDSDPAVEKVAYQRSTHTRKHRSPERAGWLGLLGEFNKAAPNHAEFEDALGEMLECYSDEFAAEVLGGILFFDEHDRLTIWALVLRYWTNKLSGQITLNQAATQMIEDILDHLDDDERDAALQDLDQQFADGALVPQTV